MKPTPTERDNLVNQLVAARVGAKVSVERVAKRAGMSHHSAIQHIENGRNFPSVRALRAYASLCKLDSDVLLLSWGYVPEDAIKRLQSEPERLLALVRTA